MNRFRLALRLLWREGRSGELTILLIALIIAVTSSTAISLFADRLHRTMSTQAAEFLAADLVITSPTLLPPVWQEKAKQLNLKQAQTAEFSSVLIENDELLLAGIKSVSELYPLRGHLKVTQTDYNDEKITTKPPKQGNVWVEPRILSALKLQLGDSLMVGEKKLTISHILTYEPDKRGDFYSFSPRVMINADDLAATEVIQAGSHVHYFFQYSGQKDDLATFSQWAKLHLNASQRLMDVHEDRPELGNALSRAERYLGLSSIIVILIAGVAIAMATQRYSERHFNTSAILRCLGCKQNEIIWLYSYQFLFLGLFASSLGTLLGWLGQQGLFYLLRDLLPAEVANPSFLAVILGFITGQAILLGFALPPLLRLKKVSALRVLRRELEPLPSSAWLVYGCALTLISLLIWRYTNDLKMTATLLGGGLITLIIMGSIIYALLIQARPLLPKLSLSWRLGLQGLLRTPKTTVSQILAFTMTLVAMILSFVVSSDLIRDWQQQLPDNAPNHFALNIFPEQIETFKDDLKQENIQLNQLYPVVKGRLVEINDTPVQQIVSKESQGQRATHRDLSLTFSSQLPQDNKITQGQWWDSESTEKGLVSIEEKLAKSLKVTLGDKLTFTVGSQQFNARISNIRSVKWDTMKPNFYMVFSPSTLDGYAKTYLTSFYLPKENKNSLNRLVKKYSAMTVLEVDAILDQFKTILTQLTQAINYLLYFALLAGFTVLFAAVYASLDQRIYEGALMRTLGANRALLRNSHLIEFSLLGFISGFLAIVIAETLTFALYYFALKFEYHPHYLLWILSPLAGTITVAIAGYLGVNKVITQPPMKILRTTADN
ncbi:MAG: FtsX-like permease family protein [Methylococcaceae bacterium]|nr:FtsX-like permease family protein [Methylococcaceae bacterium]